jgi:putative acetyltransferase
MSSNPPPIADLALRPYDESDLARVRALHALAFETLAAACHSREELAAHSAMTRHAAYADDLRASHLMLALNAAGAVIATAGWIAVPDAPGTARIRKVFVHPEVARRGIASSLVRNAETRALAAGHRHLVVRANRNAVPLYRKLGYRTVSQGSMDTGTGILLPVHFMEKADFMEKA